MVTKVTRAKEAEFLGQLELYGAGARNPRKKSKARPRLHSIRREAAKFVSPERKSGVNHQNENESEGQHSALRIPPRLLNPGCQSLGYSARISRLVHRRHGRRRNPTRRRGLLQ